MSKERPLPPHVMAAVTRALIAGGEAGRAYARDVNAALEQSGLPAGPVSGRPIVVPVEHGRHTRAPRIRVAPKPERTAADGTVFASKRELVRYQDLQTLQRAGHVRFFLRQVPLHLPGGVKYLLDFLVFWADGRTTWEDVKGMRTEMYRLKKRQVEALYPIQITEL